MKNYEILIVDDNPENLRILVETFEQTASQYILYQAIEGKTALMIAEKHLPDLIITDWEMPGMSGIELIEKLKTNPATSLIPVIMCTGVMTTSDNLKTALDAGAVDYIRKPVDTIELMARTQSMIALSESYKKIKALNETKDKIFSIIGHDLRGAVGNLKGMIDILRERHDYLDEDRITQFLNVASKNAANTFNLLENLLSWALSQQGKIECVPAQNLLNPVIEDIIELYEEKAGQKQIDLSFTNDKEYYAFFDADLITTVIRNLVSNALKFTDKDGKVSVEIEENNSHVTVKVKDTGVGISQENIDKILESTSHYSTYGTGNEKGSGLGIMICKEFIEKNNGELTIESTPDKGSTFAFTLPVK